MTFKGSVVVKKTHLLNMIQNHKHIFSAPLVSDDCKWHAWGRQISYETLLDGDISDYDWNSFMHEAFKLKPNNMQDGLDFIFNQLHARERAREKITDFHQMTCIFCGITFDSSDLKEQKRRICNKCHDLNARA